MKQILRVHRPPAQHWVGDGFPVRSLFSYDGDTEALSPFLLLDRAGPNEFTPTTKPRGVGEHPHRGFETVTLVYAGEVSHRDSAGGGGTIGPGDVQWMTAGRGVVHEEFHSAAFTERGGLLDMVQLWVNLPAADKMTEPRYQTLAAADIPEVALDGGRLRVIAGEFAGRRGPARTYSPVDVWDLDLRAGGNARLEMAAGRTALIAVLAGAIVVNGEERVDNGELALLDREAGEVQLTSDGDARVLVLGGEPLGDPVVGHGPFVMTNRQEINEAIEDFRAGRFGTMAPVEAAAPAGNGA